MEREARFERQLAEVMEASGWHVEMRARSRRHEADLVARKHDLRYAVELKLASEARRVLLEGALASAILRIRVAAIELNARPLAIVCAPAISDALLQELDRFVQQFGEGVAWGAMDESGLIRLHGPGLEDVRRERAPVSRPAAVAARADILSDLGQWMLKVLWSHRLPEALRARSPVDQVRIDAPIRNALALSKIAGVSVASAARFVAAMKEERFLVDDAPLRVIQERNLLDRWRSALKRRHQEARARWLFPQKDSQKHLDDELRKHVQRPGERACLGLFAACDRLGFRFVSGVAPHLYVEKASVEALQRFGLRLADPGESADVHVREPRFPESVFRGSMDRGGLPVADVLQCWLDVIDHPARGEEMAAHLFDRVLRPGLLGPER